MSFVKVTDAIGVEHIINTNSICDIYFDKGENCYSVRVGYIAVQLYPTEARKIFNIIGISL